jgi:hypothetical protein
VTDLADNSALLRRLLEDRLEELLTAYKPGWIARRCKAYLHPDPTSANRVGSFEVDLAGAVRGRWYRHSQGVGGWVLELFAYLHSGDQSATVTRETFDAARQWLGLPSPFGAGQVVDPEEVAKRRARAEAEAKARAAAHEKAAAEHRVYVAKRQAKARDIWQSARPAAGTLVATYLAARGLAGVVIPPTIRFHPALPFFVKDETDDPVTGETKRTFCRVHCGPAMVAGYSEGTAEQGGLKGVHVTWLAADGSGKAAITDPKTGEVLNPRSMIGPSKGGHVRLAPPAKHIAVGEGIESSLSLQHFGSGPEGPLPTFAALSLGNLDAPLPAIVESVLLGFDNDERDPKAAARAKRKAAEAHAARGLLVACCAPTERADFNDLAMRVVATRSGQEIVEQKQQANRQPTEQYDVGRGVSQAAGSSAPPEAGSCRPAGSPARHSTISPQVGAASANAGFSGEMAEALP